MSKDFGSLDSLLKNTDFSQLQSQMTSAPGGGKAQTSSSTSQAQIKKEQGDDSAKAKKKAGRPPKASQQTEATKADNKKNKVSEPVASQPDQAMQESDDDAPLSGKDASQSVVATPSQSPVATTKAPESILVFPKNEKTYVDERVKLDYRFF